MTLCPVALAVGCKRCPVFAICPAKSLIGDQRSVPDKKTTAKSRAAGKPKR